MHSIPKSDVVVALLGARYHYSQKENPSAEQIIYGIACVLGCEDFNWGGGCGAMEAYHAAYEHADHRYIAGRDTHV